MPGIADDGLVHRRHHRSHNPSPFTAYSFDLGEAALNALFVPLWMLTVPTQWEIVGLFMLHQIARNTIGHSGYALFPARRDARPLFDFLTSVTHHDLHHAQAGWNYGLYFTWWDRLMGTEHPEYYARFADATAKSCPVRARAPMKAAIFLAAVALMGASATPARAQTTQDVHDDWATRGLGAIVRLAPCASNATALCGRLTWVWDPSDVRAGAVGSLILRDFVPEGATWRGVGAQSGGRTHLHRQHPIGGRHPPPARLRRAILPDPSLRRLSCIPRP